MELKWFQNKAAMVVNTTRKFVFVITDVNVTASIGITRMIGDLPRVN